MDRQRTAPIPAARRLWVETTEALRLVERVAPGAADPEATSPAPHIVGAVGVSPSFVDAARAAGLPTVALTGDPWLDHGRVLWLADAPGRAPEAVMADRAAMCALRRREHDAHLRARGRSLPSKAAHRLAAPLRRPRPARDAARSGCPVAGDQVPRPPSDRPSVSVVIPHRDAPRMLARVLEGLRATAWPGLHIVVVDNGSVDPESLRLLAAPDLTVERMPGGFNFSRLCNRGAHVSTGEVLVFLNDDIQLPDPGWLDGLVAALRLPGVAVAGALLTYPDGTVQHAGMAVRDGVPVHPFAGRGVDAAAAWLATPDRSGVTAACMAVSAATFWGLGGFDTLLAHDYNDADLCFRARAAGGRVVVASGVRLVHHEGASRGRDVHPDTVADWLVFRTRWARRLAGPDPWDPRGEPAWQHSAPI